MAKRYVIKNSKQLGIDESFFHGRPNSSNTKTSPYWYVYDKVEEKIVEGTRYIERTFAKNHADRLNV